MSPEVARRCPQPAPFLDEALALGQARPAFAELAELRGKVVMDGGAGTGRVAREQALRNVHVVDGLLHDLPFPPGHFDVAITSQALEARRQGRSVAGLHLHGAA